MVSYPPQSIEASPNIAPTASYLEDGNCPKEGVEVVSTYSTISVNLFEVSYSSTWPPAIKYLSPVNMN